MTTRRHLTQSDLSYLRAAIDEAEVWRGSLVDWSDPECGARLAAFDKRILRMRQALDRVRVMMADRGQRVEGTHAA